MMEVLHPRCCGLDVHKDTVVACLRIVSDGKVTKKFARSRRRRRTCYACQTGWPRTGARMPRWRRQASTGSPYGTSG
jgi:hypothetical protein